MIHIVLIKPRPAIENAELAALTAAMHSLARETGALSIEIGPNVTHEPLDQGYLFGFILRFPDRAALLAYHAHPSHLPVSQSIQAMADSVLVFDLEG